MKKRHLAAIAATMFCALPSVVQAAPLDFTLDNKSSHNILYIYLSTPDEAEWGEDILGEGYLYPAGTSGKVTIGDAADQCKFDMQIILDTKQTIIESGIDLCGDATYTLSDTK